MEPESYTHLKQEIIERMIADRTLLDQLRREIRPLRGLVRPLQSRTTTSISLVAADGGNNSLRFDPFLVQIVRVVDSSNNEYCLEAITPTTKMRELNARHFNADGSPRTALGEMMHYLGVRKLEELSHIIHEQTEDRPTNLGWVKA